MFILFNVTVLQQLLTAKSEFSSSVCVLIRQDAVSCGNDVEVVFIYVDDDTQDVARVSIGTGRATLSPICCQLAA